ncbi:MAG: ImmA/IrrE family metallo-endopeptidase, partial [Chloroflexota bacterium]
WFSFFHEAGHILNDGKRDVFIEEGRNGEGPVNEKERKADRFAANFLIPPKQWAGFVESRIFTVTSIKRFATEVGIAPGIVVGRLQHDGHIQPSSCNSLKVRLEWVESPEKLPATSHSEGDT